jgi:hypothetical protein
MFTDMKLAMLSLLLSVYALSFANAAAGRNPASGTTAPVEFSTDDFDWRELVPYLFAAAALPGEQGIKAVLENSRVLRAYVANEARAECVPDKNPCARKADSSVLDAEVSKRIAEIVQEGIIHKHKTAIVDYPLTRQHFPFSEIAALKDENHPSASLILQFADHSYKAWDMQAKYGAPYDTNIFQWYSIFIYRLDSPSYTSKAVFEVDPVDGAVIKVAVSLKGRKPKNGH